ncbi:unnamed protein product [Sphagnum troendelagicum]|uniref:Synaptotagmin-2 n=1 Tax=Sphagnum troendelagicum TaxID=128251 RepID=A0ABP0T9I6_9BRYO
MGLLSTVMGVVGFGWGISLGLVVGYFLFIYLRSTDVKDPITKPVAELDTKTLLDLLPEIPLWVKNPDYDRVDWLNKFLKDLWPYLDKAICKIISETAQPYIRDYGPKFKLDSIEFESLTLGTLSPTLVGVKVFETNESQMILEPSFKFAGNPNIILAVKAFGLKATVQLVDVQIFATARVTLKPLIPIFPCFSKIVVSLMERPYVDFGLKLLGGDLMAIPGVYGFVQDFIKDQVSQLYMWPKALEIPVIDDPSAAKKPVGILEVTVLRAKNLLKMDVLGKADPYVKLQLVNTLMSKKTQTKMNTLNPEWNETFKLLVQDPKSQSLELHVYDWDRIGTDEEMGMIVVPLQDLVELEQKMLDLNLLKNDDPNDDRNKKARGVLTVGLLYKSFKEDEQVEFLGDGNNESGRAPDRSAEGGGLLVIIVHAAEDVEGKYHTNPYAKVVFRGEEKKTQIIKRNRDPRWEQTFEWQLEEPPVDDHLHVEVMSRNMGLSVHFKAESLGYVDISLSDVVNNKRINEKYTLIDSKHGQIQVELLWRST